MYGAKTATIIYCTTFATRIRLHGFDYAWKLKTLVSLWVKPNLARRETHANINCKYPNMCHWKRTLCSECNAEIGTLCTRRCGGQQHLMYQAGSTAQIIYEKCADRSYPTPESQ
jgi:hypothetical protein